MGCFTLNPADSFCFSKQEHESDSLPLTEELLEFFAFHCMFAPPIVVTPKQLASGDEQEVEQKRKKRRGIRRRIAAPRIEPLVVPDSAELVDQEYLCDFWQFVRPDSSERLLLVQRSFCPYDSQKESNCDFQQPDPVPVSASNSVLVPASKEQQLAELVVHRVRMLSDITKDLGDLDLNALCKIFQHDTSRRAFGNHRVTYLRRL